MLDQECELIDRLRRIEALFAGTPFDGERHAASAAIDRIRQRLLQVQESEKPVEYRFTLGDDWSVRLFVALLRRYDIPPYRHRGRRRTTIMARVPKSFVDTTLWPEYLEIQGTLGRYLDEVTERVISECIHKDASDAEVRDATPALPVD